MHLLVSRGILGRITDILARHKGHTMDKAWVDIKGRDLPKLIGKEQMLVVLGEEQLLATS